MFCLSPLYFLKPHTCLSVSKVTPSFIMPRSLGSYAIEARLVGWSEIRKFIRIIISLLLDARLHDISLPLKLLIFFSSWCMAKSVVWCCVVGVFCCQATVTIVESIPGLLELDHQEEWLHQYFNQTSPADTALKFDDQDGWLLLLQSIPYSNY